MKFFEKDVCAGKEEGGVGEGHCLFPDLKILNHIFFFRLVILKRKIVKFVLHKRLKITTLKEKKNSNFPPERPLESWKSIFNSVSCSWVENIS